MQNKDALVSVVVPTYNCESDKLRRTVDSVLSQSETRLQVLIIDDGSKHRFSGIEDVINDRRVCFVVNDHNMGVAASRNRGIALASCPYVAFLDAGDWWYPDKLRRQIERIQQNPQVGMVSCGVRYNEYGIREYDKVHSSIGDWYRDLLTTNRIIGSSSSVLIKRGVFDEVGAFYTEKDIPEDWDMWLRIARRYEIAHVAEVLAYIEIEADSRSSDPRKKETTYRRFIIRHEEEIRSQGLYRQAMASYHQIMAHKYFVVGDGVRGFKHCALAMLRGRVLLWRSYLYLYSRLIGPSYAELVLANDERVNRQQ